MSKGAPDYSKITLIKGAAPDGSLVTIAVDASGQILAVLKGDYLGTPTTIAVDANGHMLANIYDPDDLFGIAGYIGLAELAARLGSVMSYDRRGQLFWADDFESATLKWEVSGSGTGHAEALSTEEAYTKTQSLKLTAGSTSLKIAQALKFLITMSGRKVGFEVAYSLLNPAIAPLYLDFYLSQYMGSNMKMSGIRHDIVNKKLQYFNSSGVWTDFSATFDFGDNIKTWAKIKYVIDNTTGNYVRVMYGDQTIDMSALTCQNWISTTAPRLKIYIVVTGPGTTNPVVYIDDVVLTTNER